jgi:hypothetical protein
MTSRITTVTFLTVCSALAAFEVSSLNAGLAQGRSVATVVEGTVLVRRADASTYGPLSSGTLYAGDLVKVESGSRAVIRCTANGITHTLPDDGIPQAIADICP